MEPNIQKFIIELPDKKRRLAVPIRDILIAIDPGIKEAIKWNQLTFIIGKVNIAFIYTLSKEDYINLGFFRAVELSDPKKLFEGTGKLMRHIKIYKEKDIQAVQIKKWVKETIALSEMDLKAKGKIKASKELN